MKTKKKDKPQTIMLTEMSERKQIKQPLTTNQQSEQIRSIQNPCINQFQREGSEIKSISSSASKVVKMKNINRHNKQKLNNIKVQKQQSIGTNDSSYEILNLTFTFMTMKVNAVLVGFIFGLFLLIRYYTMGCLLYVMLSNQASHWKWIFVVILSRFLYFCIVVKISLKIPQNKTQLILKKNWNCMESEVHEYFQVLNARKLLTSILRGLIPSELSFLYIRSETRSKKFLIYSVINFIYSGIECVIYYPFFIVYMNYINENNSYTLNIFNINLTIIITLFAQMIMICLAIYLVGVGIQRKYGSIGQAIKGLFFCCKQNKTNKN